MKTYHLVKPRTYKGVTIWPAGMNSSGIRWTAAGGLKASTLEGIKRLIR